MEGSIQSRTRIGVVRIPATLYVKPHISLAKVPDAQSLT